MSMTKRYLESLPKEQQDDILGLPPDEWDESAENVPPVEEDFWPDWCDDDAYRGEGDLEC